MDGVLCNLSKALLAAHNRLDLSDKPVMYDLCAVLNLEIHDVWAPVVDMGWEFWEGLEPFPWVFELIDWVRGLGDMFIISSPLSLPKFKGRDLAYCVRGKQQWLRNILGISYDSVIFTKHKWVVSKPGAILIDDLPDYEEDFVACGGVQLIFPDYHNCFSRFLYDPVACVKQQYAEKVGK